VLTATVVRPSDPGPIDRRSGTEVSQTLLPVAKPPPEFRNEEFEKITIIESISDTVRGGKFL
jgi:hypothetical protein